MKYRQCGNLSINYDCTFTIIRQNNKLAKMVIWGPMAKISFCKNTGPKDSLSVETPIFKFFNYFCFMAGLLIIIFCGKTKSLSSASKKNSLSVETPILKFPGRFDPAVKQKEGTDLPPPAEGQTSFI